MTVHSWPSDRYSNSARGAPITDEIWTPTSTPPPELAVADRSRPSCPSAASLPPPHTQIACAMYAPCFAPPESGALPRPLAPPQTARPEGGLSHVRALSVASALCSRQTVGLSRRETARTRTVGSVLATGRLAAYGARETKA